MGGDHVLHAARVLAAQVQDGLDRLHLDAGAGELEALGSDARHQPAHQRAQPVGHRAQRQAAGGAPRVLEKAGDRALAPAAVGGRAEADFAADQVEHLGAAGVAHQQPLRPGPAHVAHGDVGQHVRVVDAGAAGEREEVGRQLRDRQLQERDQPLAAVGVAQLDPEVGAELEIGDRVGIVVEQVEEAGGSSRSWCCPSRACRSRRAARSRARPRARAARRPGRGCR